METLYYLEQKRVKEQTEKLKERSDYIKTVKKEWIVPLVESSVCFLVNICFCIIHYFLLQANSFLLSVIFILIWSFCFLCYSLFFIGISSERELVKDKLSEYERSKRYVISIIKCNHLKIENKYFSDKSSSLPLIVNLSWLLNMINIIFYFAGAFGLTMIASIK